MGYMTPEERMAIEKLIGDNMSPEQIKEHLVSQFGISETESSIVYKEYISWDQFRNRRQCSV